MNKNIKEMLGAALFGITIVIIFVIGAI